MALIFSKGYMIGNGNPNLDIQIKDGGNTIPRLYIDDYSDTIYGFDGSNASGKKWYKHIEGLVDKSVDVKVWLRGPNLGSTMRTSLAAANLLPLNEPYEGLGFVRAGFLGESVVDSVVFTTNNIVDWILVELRDKDNPEIVKYNRAGLLKNDGQIVDVDGVSLLEFPFIRDSKYFISVKHRNHLGIMTKLAVDITEPIDFSLLATEHTGSVDYRLLHLAKYCLRAGKIGSGKILSYNGSNSWTAKVIEELNFNTNDIIINTYSVFDVNLDGIVSYNGSNNDRGIVFTSIGGALLVNTPIIEAIPPHENIDNYISSFNYTDYDSLNQFFKTKDASPNRLYEEKYHGKTSLVVPKGTTAERPVTLESGMVRYNTTDNKLEYYNGTVWVQL